MPAGAPVSRTARPHIGGRPFSRRRLSNQLSALSFPFVLLTLNFTGSAGKKESFSRRGLFDTPEKLSCHEGRPFAHIIAAMRIPIKQPVNIVLFSLFNSLCAAGNSQPVYDGSQIVDRISDCVPSGVDNSTGLSNSVTNSDVFFLIYFFCKGVTIQNFSLRPSHFCLSGRPILNSGQRFSWTLLVRVFFFQHCN